MMPFLLGLFVGAVLGFFAAYLLAVAAHKSDEDFKRQRELMKTNARVDLQKVNKRWLY